MRNIKIILPLLCLLLCSCSSIYLGMTTGRSLSSATRVTDTLHNREVIILNMMHIDKEEHYDSVRRYLDDRKAEGYVTFYEGVSGCYKCGGSGRDSLKIDTLARKMRRVMGFHLTKYTNKKNKSIPALYTSNDRYVDQSQQRLGLTSENDYWVDLTLLELIRGFEMRYGEIPLTDYDFKTSLLEPYNPPPQTQNKNLDVYTFAGPIRNKLLVNSVVKSKNDKIIIVYGGGHRMNLAYLLGKVGYDKMELNFLNKKRK